MNDSHSILLLFQDLQQIWVIPIQVIVVFVLLWREIGFAAFSGIGVLFVFLPVILLLNSRLTRKMQEKVKITDERLKITNEMIQVVKCKYSPPSQKKFNE